MSDSRLQFSLSSLILLVAAIALNIWLFRLGFLYGLLGVNISKHLLIAYLCKAVGVDRGRADPPAAASALVPAQVAPPGS